MFEKIRNLVSKQLCASEDRIEEGTLFVDDLGADSLDIVQMLMQMESEFGVSFDDEEIAGIRTVGDAVRLIESKLG